MGRVAITIWTAAALTLLLLLMIAEKSQSGPPNAIGRPPRRRRGSRQQRERSIAVKLHETEKRFSLQEREQMILERPPQRRRGDYEPICQVTFGKQVCEQGGRQVPCPAKADQVRKDTQPSATGAWLLPSTYTYFLDRGLADALAILFAGASVIELGAGKGCYADRLRRSSGLGLVRAFDGAPNIAAMTRGLVRSADLSKPMRVRPVAGWVLCLETAEHVPRAHEDALLSNIDRLNTRGVVLSWSNNAGGNGHVNLRTNEWVVGRMVRMGYVHDLPAQKRLRAAIGPIHWFRDTCAARPTRPMAVPPRERARARVH